MPRDYAKRNTSKRKTKSSKKPTRKKNASKKRRTKSNSRNSHWSRLLLTLAAIFLFILFLYHLGHYKRVETALSAPLAGTQPQEQSHAVKHVALSITEQKPALKATKSQAIAIAVVKSKKQSPKPHAAVVTHPQPQFDFYNILPKERVEIANKPQSTAQYSLQIATFKKFEDADQLKAQLALLGFDAFTDKVTQAGKTLNRVNVGPYFSQKAAKADQKRLLTSNIKSILHKAAAKN